MSMLNNTEVVDLVEIQALRDECIRLKTQNDMLTDARRMDGREYRQMDERLSQVWSERNRLLNALAALYEHDADYIRVNNLGDVNHNKVMADAHELLTALRKP